MKVQNQQKLYPDIMGFDMAIALISKWRVEDPGHQKTAGDTAINIWDHLAWPEGLLSHNVYLGNDGVAIMQYSQWTDGEAIEAFTRKNLAERAQRAHEHIPGLERMEAVKYRHYRSMLSDDPTREPGCVVIVTFGTEGQAVQRGFVDTLIETVEERKNTHHPGAIASHFHLSLDGKRVLNYAEFTSKKAHEEVLKTQLGKDDEVSQLIKSMPGLKPLDFERYQLYKNMEFPKEQGFIKVKPLPAEGIK